MLGPDKLFEHMRQNHPPVKAFKPFAYYDPDGDCIEFFVSDEPYCAERIDKWATVYHGDTSGHIIGSLIKGVTELLRRNPGCRIDIECGRIKLCHILRARAWSVGDEVAMRHYKKMIEVAEEQSIEAEIEPQPA